MMKSYPTFEHFARFRYCPRPIKVNHMPDKLTQQQLPSANQTWQWYIPFYFGDCTII